ncbi:MAG: branched-chain amino acid ABC transporter permease [Armatimonadota bacterium]|nr:branched-chain amino acid ABC transporter permease [Armatimonadota bacterium]MDR5703299.1 branched-chain amino acid ABC transporter permease [Armatimonadota bacterium]MDR7434381.1 branched-chain amino acid ABC transporter permease [Armatimonadota bacterium]
MSEVLSAEVKASRRSIGVFLLAGLALGIVVAFPFVASPYALRVGILIAYYAYLGQAWNILGGYTGQFSFGHAAFFGLGAYTSSLLFAKLGVTPWIGMLAGAVAAATMGAFIGLLCFRYGLRGPYFSLATLAFAEILRVIALNWRAVGGAMGVLLPLRESFWAMQFPEGPPYYAIIMTMLAGITMLTYLLEQSRVGAYFVAIRESEDAAEAIGVDTMRYKVLAMALSSGLTALGGTFYAQYFSYIDPNLAFGIDVSVAVLLPVIIGGVGTLFGPIAGSLILTPLGEVTRRLLGGYRGVHLMLFGAILVAVILFLPHGIAGAIQERQRIGRRFSHDPPRSS